MKRIIIILIVGLAAMSIGTMQASAQNATNDRDQFSLEVEGLGCPFCAYGLEKKFKEFKGIKDIEINMETGLFSFSYPTEKVLSIDQVRDKVVEAGYTPKLTEITRANGTVESNAPSTATTTEGEMGREGGQVEESNLLDVSISVAGNCDMCKARIEDTAIGMTGVKSAIWNSSSQQLELKLAEGNDELANKVAKAMAAAGHDSETFRSEDKVYNNLPPCCLYR